MPATGPRRRSCSAIADKLQPELVVGLVVVTIVLAENHEYQNTTSRTEIASTTSTSLHRTSTVHEALRGRRTQFDPVRYHTVRLLGSHTSGQMDMKPDRHPRRGRHVSSVLWGSTGAREYARPETRFCKLWSVQGGSATTRPMASVRPRLL